MPKKSQWSTSGENQGRNPSVHASADVPPVRTDDHQVYLGSEAPHASASEALKRLAAFDEGWVRIVSHEEGLSVYYKYKFSRGTYAGGYVMWWDQTGNPAEALWGLLRKVEAVYDRVLLPTPDTPYLS